MKFSRSSLFLAVFLTNAGCADRPPPRVQLPNTQAALDRMRASAACGHGVQANAKVDHFGDRGRIRGDVWMIAHTPEELRLDLISPFGVNVATLTSDAKQFSFFDLQVKRFFVGPPSACNIARLTQVPVPGHVFLDLLRGQAPVVKQDASKPGKLAWDGNGYYVVHLNGTRGDDEEIWLEPHPEDMNKAWEAQRFRVKKVIVSRGGRVWYEAEMGEHQIAGTAKERVDPEGIDPPIPPSGPMCNAEIPHTIRVKVPWLGDDVKFRYESVTWNPPLVQGVFQQMPTPGIRAEWVTCE